MIRFVYDLEIVLEAIENEDYEDAIKIIKDIQGDLRINDSLQKRIVQSLQKRITKLTES